MAGDVNCGFFKTTHSGRLNSINQAQWALPALFMVVLLFSSERLSAAEPTTSPAFAPPVPPTAKPNVTMPTPEQDRAALIRAIQKRMPAVPVSEWSQGGATFAPGVTVMALGGSNATNINDILAIGKKQWDKKFKNGKSFADCFANGGRRAATTYPQFDAKTGKLVTLEGAINQCLHRHAEPTLEATDAPGLFIMGTLSAYLRSLSVGQKLDVRIAPGSSTSMPREHYNAGRQWFTRRIGERDLACVSCHVLQAGTVVDGAGIAPAIGLVLAWPRIEPGGGIRQLQQQFQLCMARVGAEPLPLYSQPFNDLEYFLSAMSTGLPLRPSIATR